MKKSTKIKKTKERRIKIEKRFAKRAALNRIVWDYERAKKIDELNYKTGLSLEYLFRNKLKESNRNKVYYISKKYRIDKNDALIILNEAKKNNASYKDELIKLKEKILPSLPMNFLDFRDFTLGENIREDCIVKVKIYDNEWNVKVDTWNNIESLRAIKILKQESEDSKSPELLVDNLFDVETRIDENGKIFEIKTKLNTEYLSNE